MTMTYERFICTIQCYYVRLEIGGVDLVIFVQAENELELSRKEIVERAFLEATSIPRFQYVQFLPEDVCGIEIFEKQYAELPTRYSVQSYMVKFDTNTPVDIHVNVYHSGSAKTALTRNEIIKEALDYLEDIKITGFSESDLSEIETLELEEAPSPITPYMQTHVIENWDYEVAQ